MLRWLLLVGGGFIGMLAGAVGLLALLGFVLYVAHECRRFVAVYRFRSRWRSRGKDLLLVYSNSPNWQSHVEANWLPKWGSRAVVLNWSERRNWKQEHPVEAAVFEVFADSREYNPLAIVIPKNGRKAHVVHFWLAFRDFKHGNSAKLLAAEAQLESLLLEN